MPNKPIAQVLRIVLGSRHRKWRRFMQQHPAFFKGHSKPQMNFLDWRRRWTH